MLELAVEKVPAGTSSRFLELGQFDPGANIKFNVLLLPKKKKMPLEYMKNAMNNLKIMTFGVVDQGQRVEALKHLKLNATDNFVFAYKSYNSTGKQVQELKSYETSIPMMNNIVSLMVRHTLVDIYRNNYRHYCVEYQFQVKDEEKESVKTICVLALLNDIPDERDKLKNFQKYILKNFEKKYTKLTTDEAEENEETVIQYGEIKLSWHPELAEFITKTQTKYKLSKEQLNYLIISPETNTFIITAPTNCIFLFNLQ